MPEDIKSLSVPVFAHRLVLKNSMTRDDNREQLMEDITASVEVPTEDWNK